MADSEAIAEPASTNAERMQQALRVARQRRAEYKTSVEELGASSKFLKGLAITITGVLTGRQGGSVHRDSPEANVEGLPVRVGDVQVVDYEYAEGVSRDSIPFVRIVAWTIEGNEMVCGNLIPISGISANIIETQPLST